MIALPVLVVVVAIALGAGRGSGRACKSSVHWCLLFVHDDDRW